MSRFKIAAIIISWFFFILMSFAAMEWGKGGGVDFDTVYYAVRDYLPHQLPYPSVVGYLTGAWVYPPLLALLVAPLAYAFELQWATRLWYVLNLAALLFLLVRLHRYVPYKDRFFYWMFAASFVPVFEALHYGQVTVLLLAIMGFAWISVKEGRFWVAGALLALATWIKVYPIVLIVYFLWKGPWPVVKSALLTGIVLGLFQIIVSGPALFQEFFATLLMIASQSDRALMWQNQSIYGFASHLFEDNLVITPVFVSPTLFILTRYGLTLFVSVVFFFNTVRSRTNPQTKERQFDLEYALAVMTMLLLSPWLYSAQIAPALLTFFIVWVNTHDPRKRFIIAMAHMTLLINYLLLPVDYGAAGALIYSLGFIALMAVWIVNLLLLMKLRSRQVNEVAVIAY